jgi:hypothetical protein
VSESKYTPGPWIEFADRGETVAILPAGRDGTICEFSNEKPYDARFHPEARANARLIAAAPDLLEAAQSASALLMAYIIRSSSQRTTIQRGSS